MVKIINSSYEDFLQDVNDNYLYLYGAGERTRTIYHHFGLCGKVKAVIDKNKKGIFSGGLCNKIVVEGVMIGMLTLDAFSLGNKLFNLEIGRTKAFVSMGLLELVHSFNIKSEQSIFKIGILENKFLIGSFVIGTIIQTAVVLVPSFAEIFRLVPLNQTQWIITLAISALPIPIMEIQKKLNEIKFGKTIYRERIEI